MNRKPFFLLLSLLTVVTSLVSVVPASAQRPETTPPVVGADGAFCITLAGPPNTPATASPPILCYTTEAEAQTAAAQNYPDATWLASFYQHSNYGGRRLTVYSNIGCWVGLSDLRTYGFNDIISSFVSACKNTTLYFDVGYHGQSPTWTKGTNCDSGYCWVSYVGDWNNDQASSILLW